MAGYGRTLIELPLVDPMERGEVERLLRDHDRRTTPGTGNVVGSDLFCRRIYTCRRCGHETPTVGFPLSNPECYARIPIRGTARTRRCGGRLVARYV